MNARERQKAQGRQGKYAWFYVLRGAFNPSFPSAFSNTTHKKVRTCGCEPLALCFERAEMGSGMGADLPTGIASGSGRYQLGTS